jgi:hypothetical protein
LEERYITEIRGCDFEYVSTVLTKYLNSFNLAFLESQIKCVQDCNRKVKQGVRNVRTRAMVGPAIIRHNSSTLMPSKTLDLPAELRGSGAGGDTLSRQDTVHGGMLTFAFPYYVSANSEKFLITYNLHTSKPPLRLVGVWSSVFRVLVL